MKTIISIMLMWLFLFVPTTVLADNWYVDKAATGTNAGTSWTNAWQSFNNVTWGAGGVTAGDTLYISGGSTSKNYTAAAHGMFTVGASGSVGLPVTIATGAKSPAPSGHDGLVIFDGSAVYAEMIRINYRNYIIVDGEKSGSTNWRFYNSSITDREHFSIGATGASNSKVTYVEVYTASSGILASSANDFEVSYSNLHDIRGDAAIRNIMCNPGATIYGRSKLHHNTVNIIIGSGGGADGFQTGTSTDVYNNNFSSTQGSALIGQHPDYVQTAGPYHRIYNNEFRNPIDSAIDADITGNWGGSFSHLRIYNNVFITDSNLSSYASWPSGFRAGNAGSSATWTDFVVANNTFVDLVGDGSRGAMPIKVDPPATLTIGADVLFKNNLFFNTSNSNYSVIQIGVSSRAPSDWNVDYNLLNAGANGVTKLYVDGIAYTQTHSFSAVPSFNSYTLRSPSNNVRLSSLDTAAKDKGVDLSTYFTTDKDGTSRPQGAAWDIGAYEFIGKILNVPDVIIIR